MIDTMSICLSIWRFMVGSLILGAEHYHSALQEQLPTLADLGGAF